jgi:hypothetical protein
MTAVMLTTMKLMPGQNGETPEGMMDTCLLLLIHPASCGEKWLVLTMLDGAAITISLAMTAGVLSLLLIQLIDAAVFLSIQPKHTHGVLTDSKNPRV